MDKFIVRFSIFALNTYIGVVLLFALNGVDISLYDYLFTNSALFGLVLTVLTHSQGKYHCKWARALCYNLVFTPCVNFLDSKYVLFETAEELIYFAGGTMLATIISTIILAISHFRRVRKLNKQKSRFRVYEIRR